MRDIEKWKSVPNLLVIKKEEIKKIKNNNFSISACNSVGKSTGLINRES